MLATALEFAPGTAEDCKKVILGLFDPRFLLASYRKGREAYKTGDLVIVCPDSSRPDDLFIGPRTDMRDHLRRKFKFRMPFESAHKIVQLPADSDAFWIVAPIPKFQMPIMCVLFALPYETVAPDSPLTGEA